MTNAELQREIDNAKKSLNTAGIEASFVVGTEDYPGKYTRFLECLNKGLVYIIIDFLNTNLKKNISLDFSLESQRLNDDNKYISVAYEAVYKSILNAPDAVNKMLSDFDGSKSGGSFAAYFFGWLKKIIPSAVNKEFFAATREVQGVFSEREQRDLYKFMQYANTYHGEISEEAMRKYIKIKMLPEKQQEFFFKKLRNLIKKNNDMQSLPIDNGDDYNERTFSLLDIMTKNNFDADTQEEYGQEYRSHLMDKLNKIYENFFSDTQKKYFPILVANNYVKSIARTIKDKYNEKSLSEAIANHKEEFRCDLDLKELIAHNYTFISIEALQAAQNHCLLTSQKDIASKLGITDKNLSNIWNRSIKIISENLKLTDKEFL